MAGILDFLTGGADTRAQDALKRAEQAFTGIEAPSAQQLTLPELKQMVQAGILTPAQAKTYLQQGNAYNDIQTDQGSMQGEQDALAKMKAVAEAGGMTPTMKAQLTAALDQVATSTHGTNAGIADQFAQKGVPSSLMAEAAMRSEGADDSRNANLTATQAAGQAEQNAIAAMMNEGNMASNIQNQTYQQKFDKAAAENAMRQWNAGSQNQAEEANAQRLQEANAYNQENKQNISNANTGQENQRTVYNANIPQQVFQNQVTKASGQAGVNQAQANQATSAGNQMMGLIGAGVGAASTAFAPGAKVKDPKTGMANGGLVPGDSPKNDIIPARLSPGEGVIPRSIMQSPNAPEHAKRFVTDMLKSKPVTAAHPDDVHAVLEALSKRREQPISVGSQRG